MKIAITCADLVFPGDIRIFSNGHHFNVLLWYHFFEKCGYDVVFISDRMETNTIRNNNHDYIFINYKKWFEDENLLVKENINCLFNAGLTDNDLCNLVKKHNIKRIYSMMGNNYINDIDTVIYEANYNTSVIRDAFDEIWISPHFAYSIEYYKIRYDLENIHVGPYIWSDDLIKNHKSLEYKPNKKMTVAICEANISAKKNCMIPLCICEKGEKYIEFVRCYCTSIIRENQFFKSFAGNLHLHKNKKIVFNNRDTIVDILNQCDCVISTTQECDLNYVFLECFYYGIPLIHNSKMLEEYGYYYPDLDINKAVEQIEIVFKTHNTKLYIEKHKQVLHKYSMNNTYYQEWVKSRLVTCDKKTLILERNTMKNQENEDDQMRIYNNNITIILPCTVNINTNKSFIYQTSPNDRLITYTKSILQWLKSTNINIIVVENSGYQFEELNTEKKEYADRFEVIVFNEDTNEKAQYLKDNKSKGDSELFAINYAFDNSKFIKDDTFIIKITGRYFIPEFEKYINKYNLNEYDCIRQHNLSECTVVGCHYRYFNNIFNIVVDDINNSGTLLVKDSNNGTEYVIFNGKELVKYDNALKSCVKDGKEYIPYVYMGHIETLWNYRLTKYNNVFICKPFDIENTPEGGVNKIRNVL